MQRSEIIACAGRETASQPFLYFENVVGNQLWASRCTVFAASADGAPTRQEILPAVSLTR